MNNCKRTESVNILRRTKARVQLYGEHKLAGVALQNGTIIQCVLDENDIAHTTVWRRFYASLQLTPSFRRPCKFAKSPTFKTRNGNQRPARLRCRDSTNGYENSCNEIAIKDTAIFFKAKKTV